MAKRSAKKRRRQPDLGGAPATSRAEAPAPDPAEAQLRGLAYLAELAHSTCPVWGVVIVPGKPYPVLRTGALVPAICRACGYTPAHTREHGCPQKLNENALLAAALPPELRHADPE